MLFFCDYFKMSHPCSKKARLTVSHITYCSALKSLPHSAPLPKTNLRSRYNSQWGTNLFFKNFGMVSCLRVQCSFSALFVLYFIVDQNLSLFPLYAWFTVLPLYIDPLQSIKFTLDTIRHLIRALCCSLTSEKIPYVQKMLQWNPISWTDRSYLWLFDESHKKRYKWSYCCGLRTGAGSRVMLLTYHFKD